MNVDIILWSTSLPSGNDVWLRDPTQFNAGTFSALTLVSGFMIQDPVANAGSIKVYITSSGELVAKTSAGGGDRLLNLVSGNLIAA